MPVENHHERGECNTACHYKQGMAVCHQKQNKIVNEGQRRQKEVNENKLAESSRSMLLQLLQQVLILNVEG